MSVRSAQQRMLHTLRTAPAAELNAVLKGLDLDRVFRAFDGGLAARDRRPELVHLLADERVDDLEPAELARVVHAMRSIRHRATFSAAIRSIFEHLEGERFRDFKALLNSSGDRHDLEHVVFERLTAEDREVVLERIAAEASDDGLAPDLRILSDIDDTVKSMLHDKRFERGTIYPGVVAFLSELDQGAAAEPGRPGDLTFVTARPGGPRGLIEQYTRGGLEELGLPPHAVLGGSFFNLFTKASIAARKLQNFRHERRLFPECRLVFIGDSGQADARVGASMVEQDKRFVARVFIHDVTGIDDAERRRMDDQGIFVFDTYAGAAREALRLGLISAEGAEHVVRAVREGLAGNGVTQQARQRLLADAHP